MNRVYAISVLAIALVACAPSPRPVPASPAAPVPQRPAAEPAAGTGATPLASVAPATAPRPPEPAIVAPAGALYVCVSGPGDAPEQAVIEFTDKTGALCRKHPEMGPCQYERNACRRRGGRVFAADGTEITLATEAEYDRRVRRVRFKAN